MIQESIEPMRRPDRLLRSGRFFTIQLEEQKMYDFCLRLAGVELPCSARYSDTPSHFGMFSLHPQENGLTQNARNIQSPLPHTLVTDPVSIPNEDWLEQTKAGMADNAHMEYSFLTGYCSEALTAFDRVILHGVALRWKDRAYLICAGSGVGKSTQTRFLQELRPGEFSVICGDRPILELSASGSETIVHPSPWNGKENWYGAQKAPLAGVILLQRGEENLCEEMDLQKAGLRFYASFIQNYDSPEVIKKIAELETRLLKTVPFWRLVSHDVPESTRMLLNVVFSEKS